MPTITTLSDILCDLFEQWHIDPDDMEVVFRSSSSDVLHHFQSSLKLERELLRNTNITASTNFRRFSLHGINIVLEHKK